MCMMCSDSIDSCKEDGCGWNRADGYRKSMIYCLGDTYCAHLTEKHGHSTALWWDRYGCSETYCDAPEGKHDEDCPSLAAPASPPSP